MSPSTSVWQAYYHERFASLGLGLQALHRPSSESSSLATSCQPSLCSLMSAYAEESASTSCVREMSAPYSPGFG